MEESLNQLIVCQELYSEILKELKSAHGSSWNQHKPIFITLIQNEITLFLNFIERQKNETPTTTHLEFAWNFQNRIIETLKKSQIHSETKIHETAKNVTEIMHKEVQRQMYFITTPFSMY